MLLLSAYRSDSHAAWADWLVNNIEDIEWTVRELPGRHFAWRIRGNPLSWLDAIPPEPPDRVLATSMVDLATLRGIHPQLADAPTSYYFHENQLAYPVSRNQVKTIEHAIVQIYGALAADELLFNSDYNRQSFLEGAARFAAKMPDRAPRDLAERLAPKSRILPVPVEPVPAAEHRDRRLIVWNHRWEYDKQPELFAEAVCRLAEEGIDFRLALLGKRPRNTPAALTRIRRQLGDRIVADGLLPREDYRALLGRAGIVVSTAAHEFQGLAMLEAVSAGAIPVVPDALCYPEQYPRVFRYPPGEMKALARKIEECLLTEHLRPPDVKGWYGERLKNRWFDALTDSTVHDRPGRRREVAG
ncbi:tRNA-queuosine alpha-mannosyltransferase domain-containing protein [Wenzhouxiangella sp. EGI_FJ10305]|uniref:tRNA-queuosine alpha-mannosyltransferase domain-containing protein n=1 Tax=Wenzhouxiangella sp. EGI_FJ10305 TaxID=3243768 RepID=UPI0035D6565B